MGIEAGKNDNIIMKEYKYLINGREYAVSVGERKDGVTSVTVNGEAYDVTLIPEPAVEKKVVVKTPSAKPQSGEKDDLQDALRSPLPGTIVGIPAEVGMEVKEGDTLVVLEAMKMNNNLVAERNGKVKAILVEEGEAVKENTPLVTFE